MWYGWAKRPIGFLMVGKGELEWEMSKRFFFFLLIRKFGEWGI